MRSHRHALLLAVYATLAAGVTLSAHHSLAAEFDTNRTVTVTGTVTEMKWLNPHSWLYIDVKDAKGQTKKYSIEFSSPNSLYRRGWRRDDLPPKTTVTVNGYPAKDGTDTVSALDVKLPDGRTLFAGAAQSTP